MPFVAIDPTGERICALDHDDLRTTYQRGDFTCPLCGTELVYRHCTHVRSHFAHLAACDSDYEHKGESPEHLAAKVTIREAMLKHYGDAASVDLEVPFPEIRRVADVLVTLNGWREVHEVQFSPISVEDIAERTADYESTGATVHWWLGPKARGAVAQWSLDRYGEVHTIEVYGDSV